MEPNDRNVALFGAAAVTTSDTAQKGVQPGLTFVLGSQRMLDITRIEVSHCQNMWAHYPDPPNEEEEA